MMSLGSSIAVENDKWCNHVAQACFVSLENIRNMLAQACPTVLVEVVVLFEWKGSALFTNA